MGDLTDGSDDDVLLLGETPLLEGVGGCVPRVGGGIILMEMGSGACRSAPSSALGAVCGSTVGSDSVVTSIFFSSASRLQYLTNSGVLVAFIATTVACKACSPLSRID